MARWIARVVVLLLIGTVAVVNAAGADAQSVGPTLVLSETAPQSGDRVTVTFDSWESRSAILSVCGNRAARGSGDCNMVDSQGVRLRHTDETMVHDMTVASPPFPCPCVIRAVGVETGEVAVVPIELIGHPVGPVDEPDGGAEPISVKVDAVEQRDGIGGWLRASLGGRVAYTATVTVQNRSTETWTDVEVIGTVGHSVDDQAASYRLEVPELGPSQAWKGTAEVELPPPSIGSFTWQATASGAGPSVTAETSTRNVPFLLLVLVAILVGDLVAITVRFVQRRRLSTGNGGEPEPDDPHSGVEYVEISERRLADHRVG